MRQAVASCHENWRGNWIWSWRSLERDMGEDFLELIQVAKQIEAANMYIDQLVQGHWDSTYRFAYGLAKNHMDAEMLTSDAFFNTYLYILARPGKLLEKPQQWLNVAVKHRYIDIGRGKMRQSTDSLDQLCDQSTEDEFPAMQFSARPSDQPENMVIDAEEEQEWNEVIQKKIEMLDLNEEMKKDLSLFIIRGWSCVDIAYARGVPTKGVEYRLHIAIEKLRNLLEYEKYI